MSGRPARVLVVSQSCFRAINRDVYQELAKRGVQVHMVVPDSLPHPAGKLPADPRRPADPPIYFLPLKGAGPRVWRFLGIGKLIAGLEPDIVIVDADPGSVLAIQLGVLQKRNGRYLACISCDNMDRSIASEMRRGPMAVLRIAATLGLTALSKPLVHHVFAISSDIVAVMRGRGFADRVSKFPMGFNPRVFHRSPALRAAVRARLGIGDDEIVLAYFGRMTPAKGLDVMLDGLARLRDLKWRLLLDQFSDYRDAFADAIRSRIETLGLSDRVVYFDADHEAIAGYMNATDIAILASVTTLSGKEQYGRVIPESMACGCCVVVSECGALPEIVQDAGVVVPEGNAGLLADALRRLMLTPNLRETLAAKARDRAMEHLGISTQAAEIARVVRGLGFDCQV